MRDELRLTKTNDRSDWRKRLRDMILAGGTVATVGCATEMADSRSQAEAGLGSSGGSGGFRPILNTGGAAVIPPTEAGFGGHEAGLGSGGGSGGFRPILNTGGAAVLPCGSGNPDPCICDRPLRDATAAAQCAEETECRSKGGIFTYVDDPNGACVGPNGGIIPLSHADGGTSDGGRRSADADTSKD